MQFGKPFFTFVALTAMCAPSFALTNGDFEGGASGWSNFSCNPFVANPGTRPGSSGLFDLIVQNPAGDGSIYQTETAIATGQNWSLTGWVKVNSGGSTAGEFGWFGSTSPYSPGPGNQPILQSATSWTQYTATQLMDSGVNAGYRDAQVNVGSGATYELDDFVATQVATVNDWSVY